jgi:hypothetical protein
MNSKLTQNIDKLGTAIDHSADTGGNLLRALHAAAFKKSLGNKINTALGYIPMGVVAQRAFKDVFKIKTN